MKFKSFSGTGSPFQTEPQYLHPWRHKARLKIMAILDNCSCVVLMTHIPVRTLSKSITRPVSFLKSSFGSSPAVR